MRTRERSARAASSVVAGRLLTLPVLVAGVATVWLDVVTPAARRAHLDAAPAFANAVIALVLVGFGAWLLSVAPGHRVAWLMLGTAVVWGLDGLAQAWAAYAIRADEVLPAADWALWYVDRVGALLVLPLPLLLLLYPDGRLPAGRWGRAGAASLAVTALLPLALLLLPLELAAEHPRLPPAAAGLDVEKASLPFLAGAALPLLGVASLLAFTSLLVPLALVVVRRARAGEAERRRLSWLLWAGVVDAVVLSSGLLFKGSEVVDAGLVVAVTVTAAAVSIGIARPTLVDADRLLAATVVYAAITGAVLLLDAVVVAVGGALLGDRLAEREVTLVVLALTAVGYGPLREALRAGVRRLLLGGRDDPYRVLAALASRLERSETPEQQLPAVAGAVADAFGVRYVAVEVSRPGGERVVATHGDAPESTRALPITYRDEEIGRLVLPRFGVRARLSPGDEALLGDVVRQAALAVRGSRLAEELQRSRERLVLAREDERRRIRRDLHDGLGPTLGSVAMRVDAARNFLRRDADRADEVLVQVRADVTEALADVRRLVHDLRPPALDDVGLVGALRQLAEGLSGGGLAITVELPGAAGGRPADLPPLPAAVEVAAYRIAGEAMANAARHAGARRARVRLAAADGRLRVEVTDDGTGIDPAAPAGVGLMSLRERAAELGGRTEVTCPDEGGTRVCAWLPLAGPTTGTGGRP